METITSAPGHERVARYRDFVPSHAMRFYARICHLFIVHWLLLPPCSFCPSEVQSRPMNP